MVTNRKEKDYEYRTHQFRIKKSNPLFDYCDEMCFKAKNLYNIANFYIRQSYSGLRKEPGSRHQNETDVINTINGSIEELNKIKIKTFESRKNYKNKKPQEEPNLFKTVTREKSFVSNALLDGVFKITRQTDYLSLPAQTNQAVLQLLNQDWKSFFSASKEYKAKPDKFKGKPKIPHYAKKDGRKPAIFTNQSCKIKDGHYLIFPITKLTLDIGEIASKIHNLKQVRVIPDSDFYIIDMIVSVPKSVIKTSESSRIAAMDLGVNNFAAISNNVGLRPIIIKGGVLKARNQLYNKLRTEYYSILRMGKNPKEGQFTSKRLNKLDSDRNSFIKDYFHKASRFLVDYCTENKIDTVVIGKNKGWKDTITMRKDSKQNFTGIPYDLFIQILTYKANEAGIKVIVSEESYTSKASFLDNDYIPTYGIDDDKACFSGKRISRGLYRCKDGTLVNADVNGSYNILKKVFPMAFSNKCLKDSGVVNAPILLLVA